MIKATNDVHTLHAHHTNTHEAIQLHTTSASDKHALGMAHTETHPHPHPQAKAHTHSGRHTRTHTYPLPAPACKHLIQFLFLFVFDNSFAQVGIFGI